jgi:hypothetical protein
VCEARRPLTAHGFYTRTLVDIAFDGTIRIRRYLCRCCKRTVSLLPEFALPYLRFGIVVIALFLVARILLGLTLKAAAEAAKVAAMPCQPGQFWLRRFWQQAEKLCAALAALIPPPAALDLPSKALQMLESIGWIASHRFLFADLRVHLLGRRLKIADFRYHDLRHTAASWLRMSGADIHPVAQLLGHKDLRMAARYQHLSPAFLAEAVGRLDAVFESIVTIASRRRKG